MKVPKVKKILGRLMRKMRKMGKIKKTTEKSMYDRKRVFEGFAVVF